MTVDEAASALERMRAATPSPATVSVGVSGAMPYEPLQRAFERADAALYQAKSDGRDRLVVHYAGTSLPG
jgi:PleD family two-component response regulator